MILLENYCFIMYVIIMLFFVVVVFGYAHLYVVSRDIWPIVKRCVYGCTQCRKVNVAIKIIHSIDAVEYPPMPYDGFFDGSPQIQ